MTSAMKSKDSARLRTLRAIKSAILLAKTEKGSDGVLTEAAEVKMLQKLLKQRKDSLGIYNDQGRTDLAMTEQEEIDVLQEFLPEMMSEEEISSTVEAIVSQVGASSMADMGKVMGMANKSLTGKADMGLVSQIVKRILS